MSKGFSIVLLGLDGSGKTTLSKLLKKELEKEYSVKIIPFHKWVFSNKLKYFFGRRIDKSRLDMNKPYEPIKSSLSSLIKPIIAYIDNVCFFLINRPLNNQVVIFDRFICATQIKFNSLGYQNTWFRLFWRVFMPKNTFYIDINADLSVLRQNGRGDKFVYKKSTLSEERKNYIYLAKTLGFPIINGKKSAKINAIKILKIINK